MTRNLIIILSLVFLAACEQSQMKISEKAMKEFEDFKSKPKFEADSKLYYPGISNPEMKPILTELINQVANDFLNVATSDNQSEKAYQECIKLGLSRFSNVYINLDTEDKERICSYIEELMDIVELESSDGLLNDFMYGFDPSEFIKE